MTDPLMGFKTAANGVDLNSTSSGGKNTTENQTVESLRYPYNMKIDRDTDYLEIKIAEYIAPGVGLLSTNSSEVTDTLKEETNEKGEKLGTYSSNELSKLNHIGKLPTGSETNTFKKPHSYIYLPIPQSISDTTAVSWGSGDTLDPLSAFGISFGKDLLNNNFNVSTVLPAYIQKITSGVKNIDDKTKNAIIAAASSKAYGALGGNVSVGSLISRASGQVFNPNLELLFNGVELRSFSFSFDFVSRNQTEAKIIKKIIRTFKKSMTAKSKSKTSDQTGIFIAAPDVFQLTYKRGKDQHPFLNKFKPMALFDMQLNYTGSNTYATYADGTPVHITMTLRFTELNPVYNEDYNDETDIGVGF